MMALHRKGGWFGPHPKQGPPLVCPVCAKAFYKPPSAVARGGKHCSMKCRDVAVRAKRVNDAEGTARCAKCREWKPLLDFVKGARGRPHSYCKKCNADWFADRRGVEEWKRVPYRAAFKLTDAQRAEAKRLANRRQHIRRRGAGAVPSKREMEKKLCLQDARCAYCGSYLNGRFHVDHKVPVSRGGTNDSENLQYTCPRCNMLKGAMTHEEFLVSKKRPARKWED